MDNTDHNVVWEHRQAELWDRIFQVTQDVVTLADTMGDTVGESIMKEQMVKSAMAVGRHLVRATASDAPRDFNRYVTESRLQAIETDYWLRLAYIVQQREEVQRDLSSIITQYTGIIDLLQKMVRHVQENRDAVQHTRGPKISL
jgi:four helix bundle protein